MTENKPCELCQGEGVIVVAERFVTPDMASDAGEPAMTGMHHSYDYDICPRCEGRGIEP